MVQFVAPSGIVSAGEKRTSNDPSLVPPALALDTNSGICGMAL